jgi:hypothetical protein
LIRENNLVSVFDSADENGDGFSGW